MGAFAYRLLGAATLDDGMYEGIEADRSITWQACLTVLLSSVAAGFGASGWYGPRPAVLLAVGAIALVTWGAWAMLVYQIGTRLLPEPDTRADWGELLRTIGFAASPGLFQIFAAFPRVTVPVFVAVWIWMFVAMITAVRHALDYGSNSRAVAVCALAFGLSLGLAIALGLLFGPVAQ